MLQMTRMNTQTVIALLALSVSSATALAGRSDAYLPATGPAPLRFEVAMVRSFTFPKLKPADISTKTNVTEKTQSASASTEKSSAAAPSDPAQEINPLPQTNPIGESVLPIGQRSSDPSSAAGDTLITPQILTEYLKPNLGATNGPSASVLVPFNFTPPTAKSPGESRATYKVQ